MGALLIYVATLISVLGINDSGDELEVNDSGDTLEI